jgi:hypothetical protein
MESGGIEPAEVYIFFYGQETENHGLSTGSIIYEKFTSAFNKVEFVSGRLSYIIPRDRGYILFLNVHASTMLGGYPCHHGMARPRVADGRDGLQLEVTCEYIE